MRKFVLVIALFFLVVMTGCDNDREILHCTKSQLLENNVESSEDIKISYKDNLIDKTTGIYRTKYLEGSSVDINTEYLAAKKIYDELNEVSGISATVTRDGSGIVIRMEVTRDGAKNNKDITFSELGRLDYKRQMEQNGYQCD